MLKRMRRRLPLLGILLAAACMEPADLGYHQPGKYIGKADPLIARTTTPEYVEQLRQRFDSVQTDR